MLAAAEGESKSDKMDRLSLWVEWIQRRYIWHTCTVILWLCTYMYTIGYCSSYKGGETFVPHLLVTPYLCLCLSIYLFNLSNYLHSAYHKLFSFFH